MIPICQAMMDEIRQEAATTQRVIERVPPEKLLWQPHKKSMSLGQLAFHVASIPGNISKMALVDEFEISRGNVAPPDDKSLSQIQAALDESVRAAEDCLKTMTEEKLAATWRLKNGGRVIVSLPRVGLLRTIMLNHWYHHRGQLSVYLRLLDVPLPSIYGPSADENPFV
jgi:uncharacterized damage-inducible protein DinB